MLPQMGIRRALIAISLTACIAACGFWWRSASRSDVLTVRSPAGNLLALASHRGGVVALVSDVPFEVESGGFVESVVAPAEDLDPIRDTVFDTTTVYRSFIGFKLAAGNVPMGDVTRSFNAVRIPHWAIVALTAPATLWLAWSPLKRRRWAKRGRCRSCGYDLRESPQRCPECGTSSTATPDQPNSHEPSPPRRRRRLAVAMILLIPFVVIGGALLLFTRAGHASHPQEFVRIYDAADLTVSPYWPSRVPVRKLIRTAAEDPYRENPRAANVCFFGPPPTYPHMLDERQDRIEPLTGVVSYLPATMGTDLDVEAVAWGDRLVVRGAPAVQAQYAQFLASLRQPSPVGLFATLVVGEPAKQPVAQEAERKLNQIVPEVNLDNVTLEQAVEQLRDGAKANILPDWNALEALGLDRNAKVKFRLWDVSLSTALNVLFQTAGHIDAYDIAIRADAGIIRISARDVLEQQGLELRIYDIRPLIVRYEASNEELFAAILRIRQIKAAPTTHPADADDDDSELGMTREEMIEEITTFLKETVDPDSWRDNGGSTGALSEWGSRLLVTQTPANHRRLEATLKLLYDAAAPLGPALTRPTTFPAVLRLSVPSR